MKALRLALLAPVAIALAADNSSLQVVMDGVLKGDPRNKGVEVEVRYRPGGSVLVYDMKSIASTNSMADVFRVFLQFAQAEKARAFTSVELAFRGQSRFLLNGEYYRKLGEEYGSENPVYTMRTFTENVLKLDGSRAYPTWTGGLIGVVGKQTEQFNDFHKQWYLNSLLAAIPLRATAQTQESNTPQVPLTPTVAAPSETVRDEVALDIHQSIQIPAWLNHYPQATDQTKSTTVSPFSSYRTLAPPTAVVTYYQNQLRDAGVLFQASFNGVGTSIQASSDQQACVVRIDEADGGASVNVMCASKPQAPATALIPKSNGLTSSQSTVSGGTRVDYVPLQASTPVQPTLPQGVHLVEYTINGSAGTVGVTYENASGGTEQNDAALPASMSFQAMGGSFVYLSAQNKSDTGTVHVAISIDGRLLQQASSSTRYGIATASGSVPR